MTYYISRNISSLVCTHPETKRQVLYLGRRRNAYIEGLSLSDSESLLDQLWSYTTREELAWHNEWRVGDLVLWITVAPCTAAIPSTQACAGLCTALKSKVKRARVPDRSAEQVPLECGLYLEPALILTGQEAHDRFIPGSLSKRITVSVGRLFDAEM